MEFPETKFSDDPSRKVRKDLLVTKNAMPIISEELFDNHCAWDRHDCSLSWYALPKFRLQLLAGFTFMSAVAALGFLIGLRTQFDPESEYFIAQLPQLQLQQLNYTHYNSSKDFFGIQVSVLLVSNQTFGTCLATVTSLLLMIAHFLRHPISRQHNRIICNSNLTLLIFGCVASISLILLSAVNLKYPLHYCPTTLCFAFFIIYQLSHNYLMAKDLWRNRHETWKNKSTASLSIGHRYYSMLTVAAIFSGVICNGLVFVGFALWISGGGGPQFQWLAIISVLMFYVPQFLLLVLRDSLLLRNN